MWVSFSWVFSFIIRIWIQKKTKSTSAFRTAHFEVETMETNRKWDLCSGRVGPKKANPKTVLQKELVEAFSWRLQKWGDATPHSQTHHFCITSFPYTIRWWVVIRDLKTTTQLLLVVLSNKLSASCGMFTFISFVHWIKSAIQKFLL